MIAPPPVTARRLFAIGWISLLGQVVLLRELAVALYGSELVYILALGVWLLGTATGAALGRGATVPDLRRVRALFILLAWVMPLSVIAVRGFRPLMGALPGAYLSLPMQALGMALGLLPSGLLLGLLFPWAAKGFVGPGRTLAAAYAIESVGGLGGGALATLLLRWGVQDMSAALLAAGSALLAAAWPWRIGSRQRVALIATAILLAVAGALRGSLDRITTGWTHPDLAASRDTPYGRVTVDASAGQLAVFVNDALAFDTGGTRAEEFATLAAVQREAPRRVLILGGGPEGLVGELLRHGPERIDDVEIDAALLDLVMPMLSTDAQAALRAPAVQLHVAEPRRFLDRPGSYDLILVGMPEPASGQANRFYTEEFFARCARRLGPDGVLALRLPGSENRWTAPAAQRLASIHRALRATFADAVIVPGTTVFLFASSAPLDRDPETLARRLAARGVSNRLVGPAYLRYLYTNDRFAEVRTLAARTEAPANRDARPVCYAYTLLLWLAKFVPGAASVDLAALAPAALAHRWPAWVAVAIVALVVIAGRRRPFARRPLFVAAAALTGTVLETVILLRYQGTRGVLYQDLGFLLTAFMAGLAAGAAGFDWFARRARDESSAPRWSGLAIVAGLGSAAAITAGAAGSDRGSGLVVCALLLVLCGALVAAAFAYAATLAARDRVRGVAALYAADLAGGCVGTLAAGLYLVPVVGLPGAALLALAAVLAAAVLV